MSSKSDRDNRSNQLNPNNSAYSSSRASSWENDDDGNSPLRSSRFFAFRIPPYPEVYDTTFYISAATFEGTSFLAHFIVRAKHNHGMIADSVRDTVLADLEDTSGLGIAYWRCASEWDRGAFKWHAPSVMQPSLQSARKWMKPLEYARDFAWYDKSHLVAVEREKWFDGRKLEETTDLGIFTKERPPKFSKFLFAGNW